MNELKNFILNFLEIIEYTGEKEEFIDKFTSIIYLDSVEALLKALPQEKQDLIKQQLSSAVSTEELMTVVNSNFDQKSFQDSVATTAKTVFGEYLEEIEDVLTGEQKTKLEDFFESTQKI